MTACMKTSIKILSDKYSEEEIQILYQIGVSNLKDLEFAPDFKSGFEMAMIRILLFTPFDLEKLQSIKNVGHNLAKENKIKKEEVSKEAIPEKKKINNDIFNNRKKLGYNCQKVRN